MICGCGCKIWMIDWLGGETFGRDCVTLYMKLAEKKHGCRDYLSVFPGEERNTAAQL
jgi:hypothetical protein